MGWITVLYRDIGDNWRNHFEDAYASPNTDYSFTLPGNQAGAGKTHDWEYQFSDVYTEENGWEYSNNFGGLTTGNVFGLNQSVSVNIGETDAVHLFFRKYNIRDAPPPPPVVSTIVYNGNGADGGGGVSSTTATYGTYFTFSGNGFTRTGYTFNQWQLSGNNYNQYYTFVWYGGEGTYTIYATWYPNTYTITYNGNGSDGGSTNSNTATYGSNYTFQANGFTKTGYTFLRWDLYDSGNSFVASYNEGASYGTWNRLSNHTAKAMWTENAAATYTIYYIPQSSFGVRGTTPNNTATYGSNYTFQRNGFTVTGYTFYDWIVYDMDNSYIGEYNEGQSYGIWDRTSSVKVYPRWSSNSYTITYNGNGATGGSTTTNYALYGFSFTFQTNGFTKTGYTFFKWDLYESNGTTRLNKEYNEGQLIDAWDIPYNIIAKATWIPNSYTVTFDRNGKGTGKTVTQSVGTTVTCPTLKAVGYVFGGWATSAESTIVNITGNSTFVLGAANQSFFAIWTENTNGSVLFSELQTVYGGTLPIRISEYRTESGQTTANSQIALTANFKGKGPAPP